MLGAGACISPFTPAMLTKQGGRDRRLLRSKVLVFWTPLFYAISYTVSSPPRSVGTVTFLQPSVNTSQHSQCLSVGHLAVHNVLFSLQHCPLKTASALDGGEKELQETGSLGRGASSDGSGDGGGGDGGCGDASDGGGCDGGGGGSGDGGCGDACGGGGGGGGGWWEW